MSDQNAKMAAADLHDLIHKLGLAISAPAIRTTNVQGLSMEQTNAFWSALADHDAALKQSFERNLREILFPEYGPQSKTVEEWIDEYTREVESALTKAVREQCKEIGKRLLAQGSKMQSGLKNYGPASAIRDFISGIDALPLPDADRRDELAEANKRRINVVLDDHCLETIEKLTPTGGEEIYFGAGAAVGGIRITWEGEGRAKHDERIRLEARLEEHDFLCIPCYHALRSKAPQARCGRGAELEAQLAQGKDDAK